MKTLMMLLTLAVVYGGVAAEVKTVTRDGFTVDFEECPNCPMRARFAADGKTATINHTLLRASNPDQHRYRRRRTQILERVFEVLRTASESKDVFWGPDLVRTWRTTGLPSYVVQRDGKALVLVKDVDEPGSATREVALYNMNDLPHEFNVSFASLDLGGNVSVIDLSERALPPEMTAEIAVKIPEKSAKFYRLSAEKRTERSLFSVASASEADETHMVWKDVALYGGSRRTLEFACDVDKDAYFYVTIGKSKPVRVVVRAMQGLSSLGIGEVPIVKGVQDIRVVAAEGEKLPKIKEMRMYR